MWGSSWALGVAVSEPQEGAWRGYAALWVPCRWQCFREGATACKLDAYPPLIVFEHLLVQRLVTEPSQLRARALLRGRALSGKFRLDLLLLADFLTDGSTPRLQPRFFFRLFACFFRRALFSLTLGAGFGLRKGEEEGGLIFENRSA